MIRASFRVTDTAAGRAPSVRGRRPLQRCTTTRVDPRVLAAAKKLAGGDVSRLRIEGEGSVLVVNH